MVSPLTQLRKLLTRREFPPRFTNSNFRPVSDVSPSVNPCLEESGDRRTDTVEVRDP